MLNKDKRIDLLRQLILAYDTAMAVADKMNYVVGSRGVPDSPLYNDILGNLILHQKAVAVAIGDKDEWVDWFLWEAECGRKELECYDVDGTPHAINSAEDLINFMENNSDGQE